MGYFLGCFGCGSRTPSENCDRVCPERASIDGREAPVAAMVVKRFRWEEIERLTMNFEEVIGVGGYSMVYLAKFPDSTLGAVKIYNSSERLNQVFKNELEICQKLHHAHIVKLLGYCDERDEGVLVFEYIPNGNLQDCLHNQTLSSQNKTPKNPKLTLTWKQRMSIAYQLAETLDHLHDNSNPHIIHGDIKSSNILLDDRLECQLSDFGCAHVGFSLLIKPSSPRVASMMVGSPGYMDPHFIMTGISSKKNDVYSFGVVLLELITGFEACTCSGERHVLLTSMIKTQDKFDVEKVVKMVDKRVHHGENRANDEELKVIASIAGNCLYHLPSLRPSASEICKMMREKIPSLSSILASSEKL